MAELVQVTVEDMLTAMKDVLAALQMENTQLRVDKVIFLRRMQSAEAELAGLKPSPNGIPTLEEAADASRQG